MGINLRLILIAFVVLVVGIIAFDGWRRNGRRKIVITAPERSLRPKSERSEPMFDNTPEPVAELQKRLIPKPIEPPVIVLHLMRQEEPFEGPLLLQALLSTGLRYGEMSIFHRFSAASGQGTFQFSVANAVKPGTFDLEDLESFTTPGLTLFFAADQVESPTASYDLLLEVVRKLEDRLGGTILDERRKPLTADVINHHRELLMQYETSCQRYA